MRPEPFPSSARFGCLTQYARTAVFKRRWRRTAVDDDEFRPAAGYTPYGFLVCNVTGRFQWRPMGGHFTLFGERDSVKDTQLSYGGLRDPGTASAVLLATSGEASLRVAAASVLTSVREAGSTSPATAQRLPASTCSKIKAEGTMGAYFRAKIWPGYGTLNIGGTSSACTTTIIERGMTYGQGGYFSPNVYFLASVPVSFNGYYKNDFHYIINGSCRPADLPGRQRHSTSRCPRIAAHRRAELRGWYRRLHPCG